jgi:heme-degrading monooxygenase HmoA
MVADKNARERKGGHTVHIQIITFGLKGISEEGYAKGAEAVAPTIAAMPGLLSKHWLADKETNTYGGAYVWRDREAMKAYGKTEVFAAMRDNPHAPRRPQREGLRRLGGSNPHHPWAGRGQSLTRHTLCGYYSTVSRGPGHSSPGPPLCTPDCREHLL